ncbi:uncharacterized protein LOC111831412 [Capsella rubella]|uniref:uncharacterized protein LOC111831412 n=1 Tax=Capsella rubella TaxID=81985 RepID=UPI000CD4C9D3|nr:uncharacterized protein LOC111831412 [Capsella rubella]
MEKHLIKMPHSCSFHTGHMRIVAYFKEASLLNITNQSCELFTPSEVALLECTYELEVFILKGYGISLNYKMGVPLLEDVLHPMEEEAIKAREGNLKLETKKICL